MLALLIVLVALLIALGIPGPALARTFYVSPSGSDRNRGTTERHPWRSVRRVDRAKIRPGDRVLFAGGQTFSDQALIPARSGVPSNQIVFGSYGRGRAVLTKGVWFSAKHDLVLTRLIIIDASQGVEGTGDHDSIIRCVITRVGVGINASGNGWRIISNRIIRTSDSGMILQGDAYIITGNHITNTGTDSSIPYGKHGIYLKASNSTVTRNTIREFSDDGISARFRNSDIESNTISGGPIGIGWFQYDTTAGTSHWRNNAISGTTAAAIYVSPSDRAGATRESFVIAFNRLARAGGAYMNLKPTAGVYTLRKNVLIGLRKASRRR
jgi:hypothetical protein